MTQPPSIDRNLLEKLAELARLRLPAERQAPVLQHLRQILDAFDALRTLPTEPGQPGDPAARQVALRADEAGPALPVDQVLANAPKSAAGAFVVPRVVDA